MAKPATAPHRTGRQILGELIKRVFIFVVLTTATVYAIDYAVLRYRIATNHNAFGTVSVRPYYAVPQKNHKTEFLFDDPQDETCVHSLFPHSGDSPCWYLNKHREKRIDL
jgi:hypothetical protein